MIQWGEWKWKLDELAVLRDAQFRLLLDSEKRLAMNRLKQAVEELRRRYGVAEHTGMTEVEIRTVLTGEPIVISDSRKQPALRGLATARKELVEAVRRATRAGLTGQQVTLLLRLKRFGGTIDE